MKLFAFSHLSKLTLEPLGVGGRWRGSGEHDVRGDLLRRLLMMHFEESLNDEKKRVDRESESVAAHVCRYEGAKRGVVHTRVVRSRDDILIAVDFVGLDRRAVCEARSSKTAARRRGSEAAAESTASGERRGVWRRVAATGAAPHRKRAVTKSVALDGDEGARRGSGETHDYQQRYVVGDYTRATLDCKHSNTRKPPIGVASCGERRAAASSVASCA